MVTSPSPLALLIEKNRLLRHASKTLPIRESGLTPHAPAGSVNPDTHLSREMPDSRFPHASAAEVASCVAAFRAQLDAWVTSGRLGVPLLGLPGVPITAGQCVGCGDARLDGRPWRCALCLRAVELVLGLAVP